MADYGMKISKPGFDIRTADLKDQIFNSSANSLKIWMQGSINIAVGGSPGLYTANIAHNLGYPPFFFTYFKLQDANKLWMQDSNDQSRLLANFDVGFAYANSTNLVVNVQSDDTSYTAVCYYVIFIDKAYE